MTNKTIYYIHTTMKNLKIKQKYINTTITIKNDKVGYITINTNNISPIKYQHYYNLGFDIFEEDTPKITKYKGIINEQEDVVSSSTTKGDENTLNEVKPKKKRTYKKKTTPKK